MKKALVISILVLVGIGILGFTFRGYASHEMRTERAIEWVSSELSLTEEQQAKLAFVAEDLSKFREEMRKDREEMKKDILNLIGSNEINQAKILELIEAKQKQVDDFAPQIVAKIADFHESLTPEQKKKLADEINNHSHGEGFGGHWFHDRDH